MSDRQATIVASFCLLALSAWPLLAVDLPPLQDLPNHLATAVVQDHPGDYPAFVSNGFVKTNATLFVFLHLVSRLVGLKAAAKLFVLVTLGASAHAIPRVVVRFGGRERLWSATLLAWPMVHNWYVSMGMLDFALGVALGLELLLALDALLASPSRNRAIFAALWAIVVWYTHVFALLLVGLLAVVEVVRAKKDWKKTLAVLAPPLAPAALLTAWSVLLQLGSDEPRAEYPWTAVPPWELLYNAWALWMWGFTKASLSSVVPAAVLAYFGAKHFRSDVRWLSPLALAVMLVLYVVGPYNAANWFVVNTRLLPLIWLAALVRVPARLPAALAVPLAACALLYSAGMGYDYVRIDREWQRVAKGAAAVPARATMLPLVFDRKGPYGENTWPMLHVWGLYVMEKEVSAPLVFAHSRSFPVSYAKRPPDQMNQLYLEPLPEGMSDARALCSFLRKDGIARDDCSALYEQIWADFWAQMEPSFDYVFTYGASEQALSRVPRDYREVYRDGNLVILGKVTSSGAR